MTAAPAPGLDSVSQSESLAPRDVSEESSPWPDVALLEAERTQSQLLLLQ